MGVETIILLIAIIGGFYMAWSIGANDVANAMGWNFPALFSWEPMSPKRSAKALSARMYS
jgi:hypothetical protein